MNYRECPHGIVSGLCNFCMADALTHEQKAVNEIRNAVNEKEDAEARRRVRAQKKNGPRR